MDTALYCGTECSIHIHHARIGTTVRAYSIDPITTSLQVSVSLTSNL